MTMIHVSPLSQLAGVAASLGRFDLLTLLSPDHVGEDHLRLGGERHLQLAFHDIDAPRPGLIAPDAAAVAAIIDFGRTRRVPLLVHCWAGISRSGAAVFVLACDGHPGCEYAIAAELRRRAPSATPNRLMVALADDLLGRGGAMREAIAGIGRGADAFEGAPYQLPAVWPQR